MRPRSAVSGPIGRPSDRAGDGRGLWLFVGEPVPCTGDYGALSLSMLLPCGCFCEMAERQRTQWRHSAWSIPLEWDWHPSDPRRGNMRICAAFTSVRKLRSAGGRMLKAPSGRHALHTERRRMQPRLAPESCDLPLGSDESADREREAAALVHGDAVASSCSVAAG